jgi:uracil-DNA glycosylase
MSWMLTNTRVSTKAAPEETGAVLHCASSLDELTRSVVECRACPRLVVWRETVGSVKRRAFRDEAYWARPIPGFGDPEARLLILGLAPAAHGGNRTGRVFTGDRSGDWLFAALHRAGFANQPTSEHREDGLALRDVYITAAVKCAPPDNRPLPEERDRCQPFLIEEFRRLPRLRTILCLGGFAWEQALRLIDAVGIDAPRPRPRHGHGSIADVGPLRLIGSYHPSQQNTFTGRLTENMLDDVMRRAKDSIAR